MFILLFAALSWLFWWGTQGRPLATRIIYSLGLPVILSATILVFSGHAGEDSERYINALLASGATGLIAGIIIRIAYTFERKLSADDSVEDVLNPSGPSKIETEYTRKLADLFQSNGFEDFELVSALPIDQQAYGNTQASFRVGPIVFRSTREKGEHLVEIAPAEYPREFYWDCVLAMALGWKAIEDVMNENRVPPLEETINTLKIHFAEINAAFQPTALQDTRRRLHEVDKKLQAAMTKRFADLQKC